MPPIEETDCNDLAILWRKTGVDEYAEPTYDEAEQLEVQWGTDYRQVLDNQGNTITINATVIYPGDIPVGSLMLLGELEDFVASSDNEVMLVVTKKINNDLKARVNRYDYGLSRFRGEVPGVGT